MKQLGGKTYHEMITIILKHTISNFLSTLYCWNGKEGKKAAFKDLLLAKCIKRESNYDEKFLVKKHGYVIYEKLRIPINFYLICENLDAFNMLFYNFL